MNSEKGKYASKPGTKELKKYLNLKGFGYSIMYTDIWDDFALEPNSNWVGTNNKWLVVSQKFVHE